MPSTSRFPVRRLSAIIADFEAGVSVQAEERPAKAGEHGVLKVSAVGDGRFYAHENKAVGSAMLSRMGPSVQAGDILVSRANTLELVGVAARVPAAYPHLHLSDKTWRACLRSDDEATSRWLIHVMNSPHVRSELRRRASGTSGSMKNISQAAYLGIEVPVAPIEARMGIASILDDLTTAVHTIENIVTAKQRFRRGLAQALLGGTQRFVPSGACDWQQYPLSTFLSESRDLASSGAHARKLTVRLYGRGVVAKKDRRVGSANTQYYRRRAGQLVYSKLDFLNGAFGIVPNELDGFESTLDLPAFDVSPAINPRWLLHLFSWPGFYKQQVRLANGGRKARRVNPSSLLELSVAVPSRPEQDAIACLLDDLDREILLLERLAKKLHDQKRALLEKLLSGELRLPAK
jgi:restriction endonuclease S subunit